MMKETYICARLSQFAYSQAVDRAGDLNLRIAALVAELNISEPATPYTIMLARIMAPNEFACFAFAVRVKHAGEDRLIFAHRGTVPDFFPNLETDFWELAFDTCPRSYSKVLEFHRAVLDTNNFPAGQIINTGHSLGGAYALLNTFLFRERAIVVESPGVGVMLENMANSDAYRHHFTGRTFVEAGRAKLSPDSKAAFSARAMNFVSAPNPANTFGLHYESLERVYIEHLAEDGAVPERVQLGKFFSKILQARSFPEALVRCFVGWAAAQMESYKNHMLRAHGIDHIVQGLDHVSGHFALRRQVIAWPNTQGYLTWLKDGVLSAHFMKAIADGVGPYEERNPFIEFCFYEITDYRLGSALLPPSSHISHDLKDKILATYDRFHLKDITLSADHYGDRGRDRVVGREALEGLSRYFDLEHERYCLVLAILLSNHVSVGGAHVPVRGEHLSVLCRFLVTNRVSTVGEPGHREFIQQIKSKMVFAADPALIPSLAHEDSPASEDHVALIDAAPIPERLHRVREISPLVRLACLRVITGADARAAGGERLIESSWPRTICLRVGGTLIGAVEGAAGGTIIVVGSAAGALLAVGIYTTASAVAAVAIPAALGAGGGVMAGVAAAGAAAGAAMPAALSAAGSAMAGAGSFMMMSPVLIPAAMFVAGMSLAGASNGDALAKQRINEENEEKLLLCLNAIGLKFRIQHLATKAAVVSVFAEHHGINAHLSQGIATALDLGHGDEAIGLNAIKRRHNSGGAHVVEWLEHSLEPVA